MPDAPDGQIMQEGGKNVATNKRIRLGDLLVQKGLITEEQLMRALKEQRQRGDKAWRDADQPWLCLGAGDCEDTV